MAPVGAGVGGGGGFDRGAADRGARRGAADGGEREEGGAWAGGARAVPAMETATFRRRRVRAEGRVAGAEVVEEAPLMRGHVGLWRAEREGRAMLRPRGAAKAGTVFGGGMAVSPGTAVGGGRDSRDCS